MAPRRSTATPPRSGSTAAVGEIVHKQIDLGVEVVDDGEYGKPSFVSYINERLGATRSIQRPDRAISGRLRVKAIVPEFYRSPRLSTTPT